MIRRVSSIIIALVLTACSGPECQDPRPPGPNYNYWVPEDTVEDWNEMHYIESDEYQMWITGEGDTIWE